VFARASCGIDDFPPRLSGVPKLLVALRRSPSIDLLETVVALGDLVDGRKVNPIQGRFVTRAEAAKVHGTHEFGLC
jgi:hypothetical protein